MIQETKIRETSEEIRQRHIDEFVNLLKTSERGLTEDFARTFTRIMQLTVIDFDNNGRPYEASNNQRMKRYLRAMCDIKIEQLTVSNPEERMRSIDGLCYILGYAYEEADLKAQLDDDSDSFRASDRISQDAILHSKLIKEKEISLYNWHSQDYVPWLYIEQGYVKYKPNGALYLTLLGKLKLRWKNYHRIRQLLVKVLSWLHKVKGV